MNFGFDRIGFGVGVPAAALSPDYVVRPVHEFRQSKIDVLGIEESPLAPRPPSAPAPSGSARSLRELDGWRPTRMRFTKTWPDDELPDGWFELLYTDLFLRVKALANTYFGFGDIVAPVSQPLSSSSPWLRGFSAEFLRYASQIARKDEPRGGWDAVLQRSGTRQALVVGVIAKVLEAGVFDQLLFGACPGQDEMLRTQDEATIGNEGYQRTDIRSRSIRACIYGDVVPLDFWPAADELATRLLALLLPLLDVVDAGFAASREHSLRQLHQDLHDVVAEAGYMSVAMRLSKTIFCFGTPTPGEYWDLDQANAEPGLYEASKNYAERAWRNARSREADAIAAAESSSASGSSLLSNINLFRRRRQSNQAAEDAAAGKAERQQQIQQWNARPMLVAKVQIAQWPSLERWAAVGDGQSRPHTAGDTTTAARDYDTEGGYDGDDDVEKDGGETISSIMNSQVVYYAGVAEDEAAEAAEAKPSLRRYIRELKAERRRQSLKRATLAFLVATLVSVLVAIGAVWAAPEGTRLHAATAHIRSMLAFEQASTPAPPAQGYILSILAHIWSSVLAGLSMAGGRNQLAAGR